MKKIALLGGMLLLLGACGEAPADKVKRLETQFGTSSTAAEEEALAEAYLAWYGSLTSDDPEREQILLSGGPNLFGLWSSRRGH